MNKREKRFLILRLLGLLLAACLLPAAVCAENTVEKNDPRIARLHVTYSCGCEDWLSGTMISKIGMITPSASFYCAKHGKQYSSIVFYFGWQGKNKAYYTYDGPFDYHAYADFAEGYAAKNDIAYVKFPVAIGDHTGWYPLKVASDDELKKATLTVRDTTEDGVCYDFQNVSWIQDAKIASWTVNDRDLYSTYGPPVFKADDETGKPVLVAIHISRNSEFEFCRRITQRVYNDLTEAGIFAENPGVPAVKANAVPPAAETPPASEGAPEAPPAAKEDRPAAENPAPAGDTWICDSCGQDGNIGNFCYNCGAPRPNPEADPAGKSPAGAETPEPGATAVPESAKETTDPRIAFIESTFECGCTGTSFGTMVGPGGMVVQSEALYCPDHGKACSKVVFHFGMQKNGSALDYDGDFTFHAYETFEDGFSAKNNIGYVCFPSPIGETTGWYDCRVLSDEGLSGSAATVRSLDENWEVIDIPVMLSVRSAKQVIVPAHEYFYTGVPLFLTADGKEPVLIGIECASSGDGSKEMFRRITNRVYEDMKKAGIIRE